MKRVGPDVIAIEGLQVRTIIGIFDWEREVKQPVRLDVRMETDIRKAARSDDIAHALDYKAVSKRLQDFIKASEFGLVERLAEECARIILEEFAVRKVHLRLEKPGALRGTKTVAVEITRTR